MTQYRIAWEGTSLSAMGYWQVSPGPPEPITDEIPIVRNL